MNGQQSIEMRWSLKTTTLFAVTDEIAMTVGSLRMPLDFWTMLLGVFSSSNGKAVKTSHRKNLPAVGRGCAGMALAE